MAEYQRIEYRIGKDGSITETVIDGAGASCLEATRELEQALGTVTTREFKPEYQAADGLEEIAGEAVRSLSS